MQVLRPSPITSGEGGLLALSTLVISNLCSNVIALGIQASGHTTNQPMQEGPSPPLPADRRPQTADRAQFKGVAEHGCLSSPPSGLCFWRIRDLPGSDGDAFASRLNSIAR
ncbi:hypothetical protein GY631_1292 [Trichophyton interdigitale]|uniref:Uncharacterized protein n=1 Tax=Trichophyton interdigitale TaxID=101480 RepID=A0A9P4YP34_9EURO|nr:hypothetical protein GY631_1292 [Trichophyton interdigitale]KAF3901306.1 hypothetical protein GY632_0046 [Trichophyton interdigitale]